jgi:DNA-binding FrmR family transcriptional regulator
MESDKKQILNRLATIEGHLRAIQKMIEQDRCCRDILSQTYAVERALKAFEVALVDHHLVSRLPTDRAEARSSEMLRELFEFAPLNETSRASAAWRTTVNALTLSQAELSAPPETFRDSSRIVT